MRACSILVALALAACASAAVTAPDSGGERAADAGAPRVEIGTRGEGATFTPWTDDEVIPLVWGTQGGVMIVPAVAIDGALVTATDPTLTVRIENLFADTESPIAEFPAYGPVATIFARLDGRLVNGPILDQLGWNDDLARRRIIVRAHVTGMGLDLTGEVEIELGSAGAMPLTPG